MCLSPLFTVGMKSGDLQALFLWRRRESNPRNVPADEAVDPSMVREVSRTRFEPLLDRYGSEPVPPSLSGRRTPYVAVRR
jgi:hypothetical protein